MIGLLIVSLLLVMGLLLLRHLTAEAQRCERLVSDLHRADQQVDAAYRQARRAMNEAANQSWRNLAEHDRE